MAQGGFGTAGGGIAYALTAGVVTAFNPCGFAMLPAYVTYFVGQTNGAPDAEQPKPIERVARAFVVGAVVTLGFVTVFGILGLVASSFRSTITKNSGYVSVVVGAILVLLGIAMVLGREPKLSFLKVGRIKQGSSLRSMYVFGLSYAVVSMSCGFGGFLGAVGVAIRQKSFGKAFAHYVAFALGMGLVLMVLSVAAALAQQAFIRSLKKILPYINRISGALLILAAIYLIWYGVFEIRGGSGDNTISTVTGWSGKVQSALSSIPTNLLFALLALVLGLGAAAVLNGRARSQNTPPKLSEGDS